jgi:hypothetical protein
MQVKGIHYHCTHSPNLIHCTRLREKLMDVPQLLPINSNTKYLTCPVSSKVLKQYVNCGYNR